MHQTLDSTKKNFFILIFFDSLFIAISWAAAYFIRFIILAGSTGWFKLFACLTPLIIIIEIYFFNQEQLYKFQIFKAWHINITSIVKALTQGFFTVVVIFYFFFPDRITRLGLAFYFLISVIITIFQRIVITNILLYRQSKKNRPVKVFLIGNGKNMDDYIKRNIDFKSEKERVQFTGWYDSGSDNLYNIRDIHENLSVSIRRLQPDLVVIGYPPDKNDSLNEILSRCYDLLIPLVVLPNISYSFLHTHLEDFRGIPTLYLNHFHLTFVDRLFKRIIDIVGAVTGLVLSFPLYLILPLLIKLSSPGPVFYGQERMTRDGRRFKMWKFRSMRTDSEEKTGAVWAKKDDPRTTPLGKFIRATSIDELPQFWNILKGDMSLVGPRPERPELIEKFKNDIPGYMLRHKMKAGLTGWAQINGWRGNTSLEKRIEYDLYYIKNWTVYLDMKIIFLTFFKGFVNKNAY